MFTLSLSTFLGIILRTILVYLVVLVGLRLSGKREIGQMTVFDLVLHGEVISQHLRRVGIDDESLLTALSEHGVAEVSDVEMVVLEIDGSISVVPVGVSTTRVKKPMKLLRHQ